MTKWGKSGRLWIAAVAAILPAIGGCGEKKPGGPAASELGFRHYAGAVQYPAITKDSGGEHGLDALVPYGDCVLGVGTYSNGHRDVGVNWTGYAACTKLSLHPAPETRATPGEVPGDMAPGTSPGAGVAAGSPGGRCCPARTARCTRPVRPSRASTARGASTGWPTSRSRPWSRIRMPNRAPGTRAARPSWCAVGSGWSSAVR
ncbi:hypothetical protein [Streptomyces violaceusniger]|uniref:hypothetical protein n=1 Tax=Streptomyces violaceusniger TaxID=68280 RepID=UPI003811EF62